MLVTQFRLFVDPNLKANVEGVATLNKKRIGSVIDKLPEVLFPEERPANSSNGMIGVKIM